MSQAKAWGERPSKKASIAEIATLDQFVNGSDKEDTVRLNVDVPRSLRARVKVGCALEGREIRDVVIELLEKRFSHVK